LHINAFGQASFCYKSGPLDNLLDKDISKLWNCQKWNQARRDLKTCQRLCRVRCGYKAGLWEKVLDGLKIK